MAINGETAHILIGERIPVIEEMCIRDSCKSKLSSIKYIIAGSQVLDRQLMEQLQHICPDMEFILYYGASELNYITYCTGKEWLAREGTVGRPVSYTHLVHCLVIKCSK